VLLLACTGAQGVVALAFQRDTACGALCRRTCCKPSDCATIRGQCCCTERGPVGTTARSVDAALLAIAPDVAPDKTPGEALVARQPGVLVFPPSAPDPPPR
jgi:hypothetical protein